MSKLTWIWGTIMFMFGVTMIVNMLRVPMWQDEYVFYRITQELPSTATSADWFYKDNPKTLYPSDVWDTMGVHLDRPARFHLTYDTPMYVHIPLSNYLVYPLVKLVDFMADKGVFAHIEDNQARGQPIETMTIILRLVPIGLFLLSMWLIFKMMARKVGKYALLMVLPIVGSMRLLDGIPFFYWDSFMWFFFMLTLYLQDKGSKWAYLTACCMVNTKITIGLLLLIPFIIKDRKMILAAFSLAVYYIGTIVVTGDWLWIFKHLLSTTSNYNYTYVFWNNNLILNLGLPIFALLTVPILYYAKKYPFYALTWVLSVAYAWGIGLSISKMSSMIYGGVLVFPLVAYEWKLYVKLDRWLPFSKGVADV